MEEIDYNLEFHLKLKKFPIPLSNMFCEKCLDYCQGFLGYCLKCCENGEYSKDEVTAKLKEVYGDSIRRIEI